MGDMKKVIAVLAATSMASGIDLDGLRVKFGWSDALANIEYFYKIPRTLVEAEMTGWKRTERPEGPLPDLRLYCMPGSKLICPLYDVGGFVAGLQLSLPKDEFEVTHVKPSKKMARWTTKTSLPDGDVGREYWTLTQYYVSEESLKAGAGPQVESRQTLQDGGVWVMGPDAHLIRIPTTEAELNSTTFKRQNCIPNMGTHYYYNMTPTLRCEDIQPWFALVSQGELVGTGFQLFGSLPKQKVRDWFERPPAPRRSAKMTIPSGPACLYDWASEGVVSLHIYYVDKPWTIRCREGDSIKPAPAHERLLLSGYRYASKISDEFKRLFSG